MIEIDDEFENISNALILELKTNILKIGELKKEIESFLVNNKIIDNQVYERSIAYAHDYLSMFRIIHN